MSENFVPMHDNIMIKRIDEEEKVGSILLGTSDSSLPNKGEVIATGLGKYHNGTFVPTSIHKGDKVIYNKFVGSELKLDGETYLIIKESEILGKLV